MFDDDIHFWLGLAHIEGLGTRGAHKLLGHFGTAQAVYMASLTELEAAGIPAYVAQSLFAQRGLAQAEKDVENSRKLGCQLLSFGNHSYPPLLRQIPDPPLVLYVRGDVPALSRYAVAVVGTRRPSAYGQSLAHRLARDLADRQLVITSGLARGIDSCAHRGALEAQSGRTVAVLGSGVDVIYPRENRRIADKIMETGALISEFPLGTGPMPENFPIRNRIISGLSLGVLVVEASEYSGSLITARLAAEQNREVFALPGNVTSSQSFGPNHLIKQGAKLVDQWMDIVEEFPPEVRSQLLPPNQDLEPALVTASTGKLFDESLSPDHKAVLNVLRPDEMKFVDLVVDESSLPQPRVLALLLDLEMNGLIRQLPGMNFVRKI
jgi:DNA processing protein